MTTRIADRIAASLGQSLPTPPPNTPLRLAVPFYSHSPVQPLPEHSKYAHIALLLSLSRLSQTSASPIEPHLISASVRDAIKDPELEEMLLSLCTTSATIDEIPDLPVDWNASRHSHPLLTALAQHCRKNRIQTLACPTTLSNLYNLVVRYPKISTPMRKLDPANQSQLSFLDDVNGYLIPNVFKGRNVCADVVDLEALFGANGEEKEDVDVGVVMKHIVDGFESLDQQVHQILDESTVRDPPTGTCFLTIPTNPPSPLRRTSHSLLPTTHWLHTPHLAHAVLRNLVEWTSCNPSATSRPKLETMRTSMLDFYEAAGRLASPSPEQQRQTRNAMTTSGHTGLSDNERRMLQKLANGKKPRLGNADVQIQSPSFSGFVGDERRAGNGEEEPWVFARASIGTGNARGGKVVMKFGEVREWDDRFYVSVGAPVVREGEEGLEEGNLLAGLDREVLRFCVRAFTMKDYHGLLDRMHHGIGDFGPGYAEVELVKQKLAHYLRAMPVDARHTIPCVALVQDTGDDGYVLAIPSVGVMTEKGVVDVKLSFWGEAWRGIRGMRKEVSFFVV
ncbi:hypothetical protein HDU98_010756 [Podochytrium sp. JEL0797]|nr:hypothetical protein HDU98_010756 [Podochytrium sp. JEL0797]